MTGKQVLLFQGGIVVLLLLSIGIFGYLGNNASETATRVEKKQDAFVEKWENRIKISNTINNNTQLKIANAVTDILGNLTNHRIVTNNTNTEIKSLENQTSVLIKKFNQTNEIERVKAVNNILDAVSNNTEILKQVAKVLNVTDATSEPENPQVQLDLEKILQRLIINNTS